MKLVHPNFELSASDIGLFKIREGVKKNLEFSRFGLTHPPLKWQKSGELI